MIWLTGDTHGGQGYDQKSDLAKLHPNNFPDGQNLTKNDFIIICGDFGLIFDLNKSSDKEKKTLNWLNRRPWTTLFLDGNHENHDRLARLPQQEKFGGQVGQVADTIFHLKRGEIYQLDGKTFFVMGGATSSDKNQRDLTNWWQEEEPSVKETYQAFTNLEKVGNKVDYILTHTAPESICRRILGNKHHPNNPERFLQQVAELIEFKKWFFGHWHIDREFQGDKFCCLYQRILLLD